METGDAIQQLVPADSNWLTLGSLFLIALIFFFRDGLPFLRKKATMTEVKTELAPADQQIIHDLKQEFSYLRAEMREVRDGIQELLVASKVAAALRGKDK